MSAYKGRSNKSVLNGNHTKKGHKKFKRKALPRKRNIRPGTTFRTGFSTGPQKSSRENGEKSGLEKEGTYSRIRY